MSSIKSVVDSFSATPPSIRITTGRPNMPNKENYAKNRERNVAYNKQYYIKNRDSILKRHKEYIRDTESNRESSKKSYKWYRDKFLELYGGACKCCGEDIKEFLTIEHINGQRGTKKQTSYAAYRDAVKNYNTEIYEILCMNCNHARGRYGNCPHTHDH